MAHSDWWRDDQERRRYPEDEYGRTRRRQEEFYGRADNRRGGFESRSDEFGGRQPYGRGSDYEGDGTIARRGFGNERAGFARDRDDRRGYRGSESRSWKDYGSRDPDEPESRRERTYGSPGGMDWRGGYRASRRFPADDDRGSFRDRTEGYVGRDRNYGISGGEGRSFRRDARDEIGSWFGSHEDQHSYDRDEPWDYQSGRSHRGRGPKGYTRSDERIHEDVCERLTNDPFVDASEIEISVSNREVTLSGTVAGREAKRRAEDCAERVSGVTHVQNNPRVPHGMGSAGMGTFSGTATGEPDRRGSAITSVEVSRAEPGSRFAEGSKT